MKDVKILLILGGAFAILLSCSIPRGIVKEKESIRYTTIKQPTIIRDTVYKEKGINPELREYFENSLKDYRNDNLKQASSIEALKRFIDSLAKANVNMFNINNNLVFNDIINQRKMLENRELLLIEREKYLAAQRENKNLIIIKESSERLTSIFLITGVVANLLMTITLYFYKRKQIQQLKKHKLIHA